MLQMRIFFGGWLAAVGRVFLWVWGGDFLCRYRVIFWVLAGGKMRRFYTFWEGWMRVKNR